MTSIKIASIAAISASILYTAVFLFLAFRFNYPDVLDVSATEALPNLIQMGSLGRAVWALYALIPFLWIPIGVGSFQLLKKFNPGGMLSALILAVIGGLTGSLGLSRWPTIQWELGEFFINADSSQQSAISSIFTGLNVYLGQFIGEFMSEFAWSTFFVIVGFTLVQTHWSRWFGYLTIFTGAIHLIAMFRNISEIANGVQDIINTVLFLPIFLIIFGIMLWKFSARTDYMITPNTNM